MVLLTLGTVKSVSKDDNEVVLTIAGIDYTLIYTGDRFFNAHSPISANAFENMLAVGSIVTYIQGTVESFDIINDEVVNVAPVAKTVVLTPAEMSGPLVTLNGSDFATDTDPLTITNAMISDPTMASVMINNGQLVIRPSHVGTPTITVTVSDGKLSTNVTVVFTIVDVTIPAIASINANTGTEANYTAAGITGVTAANLVAVNTAVATAKTRTKDQL